MITASFFILASSLPPAGPGQRNYADLALALIDGDAKNDRQTRHIQRIAVSEDEERLFKYLDMVSCTSPTAVMAILGFGHRHAKAIGACAAKSSASLVAINAPGRRHPAALVAVANRTMRVRPHHLYYSDGRSAPLSTYSTCASDALVTL
jgi:hypothetical protein